MHSHELTEALAAVVLVLSGMVFVPASLWLYVRRDPRGASPIDAPPGSAGMSLQRTTLLIAAALSLAAAVIHLAAVGPHLDEFAPYAYAFAILGVVQLVLALGLIRGWPLMRFTSIALSAGVVAVWIISRTVGLPFGPEPWSPESVGLADVVSSAFELALIALLLITPRAVNVARSAYVALVPIVGVIGLITLIAVAALGGEAADHMHGA